MTQTRRGGTVEGARFLLKQHGNSLMKYLGGRALSDEDFEKYLSHLSSEQEWEEFKTKNDNNTRDIEAIDALINDGVFQESLILQDLRKAALEMADIEKKIKRYEEEYESDRLELPFDEWPKLKENQEHLQQKKAELLNECNELVNPNVIDFQAKSVRRYMLRDHHSKFANRINQAEAASEAAIGQSEFIKGMEVYVLDLESIGKVGAASIEGGQYASGVSQAFSVLEKILPVVHYVPMIGDYFRGLNYLREFVAAVRDKDISQRKTKIAAGLFGGLVSLCAGTLGALLIGGIAISPFGIAAVTVGVYSVALYRDGYILHRARRESQKIAQEIQDIDVKIQEIEKETKQMQEKIGNNLALEKNDPRLLYMNLQKANLKRTTEEREELITMQKRLHEARSVAYKKVAISLASFIAVGLALTALCVSGVGALAVSTLGATILIAASVYKVHVIRQAHKKESNVVNTTVSEGSHNGVDEKKIFRKLFGENAENQLGKSLAEGDQPVNNSANTPPDRRNTAPNNNDPVFHGKGEEGEGESRSRTSSHKQR